MTASMVVLPYPLAVDGSISTSASLVIMGFDVISPPLLFMAIPFICLAVLIVAISLRPTYVARLPVATSA
jgi:hypothetical protein